MDWFRNRPYDDVTFDPSGLLLAGVRAGELTVVESGSGKLVLTASEGRNAVAFSPNGRLIATPDRRGRVMVWDVDTGHRVAALSGLAQAGQAVAFSPGSLYVAAGDGAGRARIWEIATGEGVWEIDLPLDGVAAVGFQAMRARLVTADRRGRIVRVGLRTGEPGEEVIPEPSEQPDVIVERVALGPDGGKLAMVTRREEAPAAVALFDTLEGRLLALTAADVEGRVLDLAFSGDARRMAAATDDGAIHVWDARSGFRIDVQPLRATAVALDGPGCHLAAGEVEGLHVHDVAVMREELRAAEGA